MARRSTARAAAGSAGGPKTRGPASCIAPNPVRLTVCRPSRAVGGVVIESGGRRRVAPASELGDESRPRWTPVELGLRPSGAAALIEQEDFGEVVAQARPSLIAGARDGAWSADRDGGRLGQLGNRRVESVADDVAAASRVVLQH